MSRRLGFIVLFLVLLGAVITFGWYLSINDKEDWTAINVKPIESTYLPTFSSPEYPETKIFLVNTTARYSFWRENDTVIGYLYPPAEAENFPVVRNGDPMFIITATIRNDYPCEESIHVRYKEQSNEYFSYVGLSAKLFGEDGSEITAINTDDRKGMEGYIFKLGVNETKTVEIPFATENRNIAYYEIWTHYIYANPR